MGHVKWTTQAPMPKCFHNTKDAMFEAGEERTGIPYSAVHDWCGYVGKDISYRTFLSAVNNPRSSMYLVNYHLQPYDRAKAGPFYGTVCTATANYVLGLPMMLFCRFIRGGKSCYYEDRGNQIDSVQLFNAYCYSGTGGHIVVICGIGRDKDGRVQQIQTFEGTGPVNRFKKYTREQFQENIIDKRDGHFSRFAHEIWEQYVRIPAFVETGDVNDMKFNEDLSPEDGECVTYPEGRTVKIDILNNKYKTLELYRDGALYAKYPLKDKDLVELKDLPTGLYSACLSVKKKKSAPVEFQVAQKSCEAWYENGELFVSGCRDGIYPQGAYFAKGDKISKKYSTYLQGRLCIPVREGVWKVAPGKPDGEFKTVKINLVGKYSAYWSEIIRPEIK